MPEESGHTLEERFKAGESELVVGVGADREAEKKDTGYQRGYCDGVFPANILHVDGICSNERPWDANDRCNGVIAINNVVRCRWLVFASVLEILWEEGIEKRVSHSNRCPAKPDQACCDSMSAAIRGSKSLRTRGRPSLIGKQTYSLWQCALFGIEVQSCPRRIY